MSFSTTIEWGHPAGSFIERLTILPLIVARWRAIKTIDVEWWVAIGIIAAEQRICLVIIDVEQRFARCIHFWKFFAVALLCERFILLHHFSETLKNKSHKTRSPAISYSSSSVKEARVESIATDGGVKKTKVVRPDKDHHPDKDRSSKHTVEKTDPRSSSSRNDTSAEVSRLASSVDKKRTAETVGRSASVKETDETLLSTRQITDEQKRKTKDDEKDEKKKESKDAARNHVRKGFYRALMARWSSYYCSYWIDCEFSASPGEW